MKRNERTKLILFAVGLTLLLVARDIMGIGMSKYIYLAFCAVFFLVAEYQTLVYMICFVLPLLCGLPGTYIMTAALVMLVAKSRRINLWQITLIVAVAVMELFASVWYPVSDFVPIVNYVAYAGVMFFLIHDKTDIDYVVSLRMYLYSICVLCVIIIAAGIMEAPDGWIELLATGNFRFGKTHYSDEEGMALVLNANGLGLYSAAGVCAGVFLADRSKGAQRIWMIALTIVAASGGLMSISRTWVFVVAICLFFYILGKVRHPRRFIAVLLVFGFLAVCLFLVVGRDSELMEAILEAFDTRMNDNTMSSGNGRVELFEVYMEAFLTDYRIFLFGSGVTQYIAMTGNLPPIHNGTQQILVCCGIFGFAIFMFGMLQPIFAARKKGKKPIVYWIPLIGMLLYLQTTQFLNPAMQMLPYIIGIMALKINNEEKRV